MSFSPKQKLKLVSEWFRVKLFGPESPKVHLLNISIGISTALIGLIVGATALGVFYGRHWVWGTLLQITGTKQAITDNSGSTPQSSGSGSAQSGGSGNGSGGDNGDGGGECPPDESCPCPPNTGGDTCKNRDFTIVGWATNCNYEFSIADDPISFFGKPGQAALNDFRGNKSANANSTYDSLRNGDSTCLKPKWDKSSYYFREMLLNGSFLQAKTTFAYYELPLGIGDNFQAIEPFPSGIQIITSPDQVFYSCTDHGEVRKPTPTNCNGLHNKRDPSVLSLPDAWVRLPNCWDGVHLKYLGNVQPLVYPSDQGHTCPADHPHILPFIKLQISWDAPDQNASGATFATSDGANNGPFVADLYNAWDQNAMNYLTTNCLQANISCGAIVNACGAIWKNSGVWDEAVCGVNKHI